MTERPGTPSGRSVVRAVSRRAPRRRNGSWAGLAVAWVACGGPVLHAAPLPGPDTSSVRVEVGPGVDLTNEIYYEDALVDTTFLGRRLVDTPEARSAAVLLTVLQGTRGDRSTRYLLQNELSLGDRIQRDVMSLAWRQDVSPSWRISLDPSAEWRRDRSFDRDQQEWRAALRARARRSFADDATALEGGLIADLVRSRGPTSAFLLDRNAARLFVALDRLPLLGDEWRIGYGLATRVFPDSAERDHFEHGWEARWRHPFGDGHAIALETAGQRRVTHDFVSTSRDNFWQETGSLDGDWRAGERWGMRLRVDGEAIQYDLEDSTVFFDYQVLRGRAGVRRHAEGRWSVTAGPRGEILLSRLAPGESYREVGGEVEVEFLGARSWWTVTPAIGWRAYDDSPQAGLPGSLHSSFVFASLDAFVDQPLLRRWRIRGLTSLRYEAHADETQDAASVYLTLQLRWLAR